MFSDRLPLRNMAGTSISRFSDLPPRVNTTVTVLPPVVLTALRSNGRRQITDQRGKAKSGNGYGPGLNHGPGASRAHVISHIISHALQVVGLDAMRKPGWPHRTAWARENRHRQE